MSPQAGDFTNYMLRISQGVAEHGWMIQGVTGSPPFSYTIGLAKFLHPDLVVYGVNPSTAQTMLNEVGQRVREGEKFTPGVSYARVLRDLDVRVLVVPPEVGEFGVAARFYREHDIQHWAMLQLVWPDKANLFPWDKGFDENLRPFQPLLGSPETPL